MFACSHGGAFMLGHLLRAFASSYGMLPVLLAALASANVAVQQVTLERRASGALSMELRCVQCDEEGLLACVAKRTFTVRYVATDITSASGLLELLGRQDQPARGVGRVGVLIKAAEMAFRNGGIVTARRQLAGVILKVAHVFLQDTATGIEWPLIRSWADEIVPFGVYASAHTDEAAQLGALWNTSTAWRPLQGTRFGY
eukprot:1664816-Prymnesium_polylepis.1